MARPSIFPALGVQSPYDAFMRAQEHRRQNRLAQLQERQVAMAEQELAREQEQQSRIQNALTQLAAPGLPEEQRQAATLRLYGEDPRVAAGVSAELTRAQELQRQRQIEEARQHYFEADYVIRNPQFAVDFFRRRRPDEYAQVAQQLGREPTTEDVIRFAHLSRAQYGAIAGIDPMASRRDLPAAVQEWQYYSSLPPEQQQRYLQMKRATDRVVEIGGVPTLVQTGVQPTTRALSMLEQEIGAAAQKERAKTTAREQAEADVKALEELPRVEQQASQMLALLDQLERHPGLSGAVGLRAGFEFIPGTPQADFVALHDQVTGRLFMEAFQTLKGGGQITEKEGEKAQAAISRLQNRRQSEAAYRQALNEIREVVAAGLARARQRAQQAQGVAAPTLTPAPAPAPSRAPAPTQAAQLPATNERGWRLMVDAQGNRAYVSPDGTQFEEVR